MLKPKLIWEKWACPYGSNVDDIEFPHWNDRDQKEKSFDKDDEYDLLELGMNLAENDNLYSKEPIKIIATPMGIVPLTEYTNPSKVFNFWVCHTNFRITDAIRKKIDRTDGVETLDIYTGYRMRIGIGKAFNSAEVRYKIQQQLYKHVLETVKNGDA